jgi:hypothetical protein
MDKEIIIVHFVIIIGAQATQPWTVFICYGFMYVCKEIQVMHASIQITWSVICIVSCCTWCWCCLLKDILLFRQIVMGIHNSWWCSLEAFENLVFIVNGQHFGSPKLSYKIEFYRWMQNIKFLNSTYCMHPFVLVGAHVVAPL